MAQCRHAKIRCACLHTCLYLCIHLSAHMSAHMPRTCLLQDYFKKSKTFRIDNNNSLKIKHTAVSPSEEFLVCCVETGQVYTVIALQSYVLHSYGPIYLWPT